MALDQDSVRLGISILEEINKNATVLRYRSYDKSISYVDTNIIYCVGEKSDGGYENVFTNIENMTNEQLQLWFKLVEKIPYKYYMAVVAEEDCISHSHWLQVKDKKITCIGWL